MHFLYIWVKAWEKQSKEKVGRDGGGEKKITRLVGCATVYVLIHLEWLQSVRILGGLSVVETNTRVMLI